MSIRDRDVYEPADEAEAIALTEMLEVQGVAVEMLSYHDTAFDGVFQAQKGWGKLRVAAEDEARALQAIEEWKAGAVAPTDAGSGPDEPDGAEESARVEPPPTTRRNRVEGIMGRAWRIARPIVLLGSIGLNVWFLLGKLEDLPGGAMKVKDPKGNVIAKIYYKLDKKHPYKAEEFDEDGKLLAVFHDKEMDGRYERAIDYARDTRVIRDSADADGDGRYERVEAYYHGSLSAVHTDTNLDGFLDRVVMSKNNRETAQWDDADRDGWPEEARPLPRRPGDETVVTDLDGDGFPETVRCASRDGRKLAVHVLRCEATWTGP